MSNSFKILIHNAMSMIQHRAHSFQVSPVMSSGMAIALVLGASYPILAQQRPAPDFTGTGQPVGTRPTGTRGGCPITELDMIPLVPQSENGGWTTEVTPTVWVYVPYEFNPDYSASFVIKNAEGRTLYRESVDTLPEQPGIVELAFPSTVTLPMTPVDMENPEFYTWQFNIDCDPMGGRPERATAVIRRVDIDMTTHPGIQSAVPQQMSHAYADHKVWYDALTVLGDARMASPDNPDLRALWQQLLLYPSVGLEAIATEPLAECCMLLEE